MGRRPRPRRHVAEHRWLRGAGSSSVTRRIPGGNRVGPLYCYCYCRTAALLPLYCGAGCRTDRRSASAAHRPCRERAEGTGTPAPARPLPDGLPNGGVMSLPQLTVYRHDRRTRALITLAGEIDLASTFGARFPGSVPARRYPHHRRRPHPSHLLRLQRAQHIPPRRASDHRGRRDPAAAPPAGDAGSDSRPRRLRVPGPRSSGRPPATSSRTR